MHAFASRTAGCRVGASGSAQSIAGHLADRPKGSAKGVGQRTSAYLHARRSRRELLRSARGGRRNHTSPEAFIGWGPLEQLGLLDGRAITTGRECCDAEVPGGTSMPFRFFRWQGCSCLGIPGSKVQLSEALERGCSCGLCAAYERVQELMARALEYGDGIFRGHFFKDPAEIEGP